MPDRRALITAAVLGSVAVAMIVVTLAVPDTADHQVLRTLLPLGLGVGLAAGLLATLLARRVRRRRAVVLPAAGLVLGLAIGLGTDLWRRDGPNGRDVVYHGRYVPVDGITMSKAYSSTLDVTYDVVGVPPWSLFLTGAAAGLVAGLVVWLVRIRGWPWPSGRARR